MFVRLERLTDPALVAAEIAAALARRDGADGPGADGLPAYLRERELLLVHRQLRAPARRRAMLIAELLELAPGIRVIVSSRTALRIRGEHVFEVEPLALPGDDSDGGRSRRARPCSCSCSARWPPTASSRSTPR